MTPHRPGSTRTAAPQVPDDFWTRRRMLTYLLFDATGLPYMLVGLLALRVAFALRSPEAWARLMQEFSHPLYVAFHLLALVCVLFVGVRFFRLFPKAQPAHIGPAKPPPRPLILVGLYAAWLGLTLALLVVLGGLWP
jgi:fumarate reductase subunit C